MNILLRDYQIKFISDISRAHREGHDGIIGQMPTGSGKTICFARISKALSEHGGRVMIVVHRDELIDQTCKKLDCFGLEYGVIAAKKGRNKNPSARIQVGMVQTLARRLEKLKNSNLLNLIKKFHYIIFDEVHLSASESYKKIISYYPDARRLGLSATPWRLDGQGLKHIGSIVVKGPSVKDLISVGSLVPFTMFAVPVADLTGIKIIRGEYDPVEQSARFKKANVVGDVIKHFVRLCKSGETFRSTIGFFTSIEHSERVCSKFNEIGIVSEHIDGTTPKEDRKKVLDNLASGKTIVVCNYGCLTEGFDCERVSCIIVCRKTKSSSLFRQMCGRGLRPDKISGKMDCIIIDHGMNGISHGNLDYEYPFSLDGKKKVSGHGDRLAKICKACSAYCELSAKICHVCGHSFVVAEQRERKIKEIEAELLKLEPGYAPQGVDNDMKQFRNHRISYKSFDEWFSGEGLEKHK